MRLNEGMQRPVCLLRDTPPTFSSALTWPHLSFPGPGRYVPVRWRYPEEREHYTIPSKSVETCELKCVDNLGISIFLSGGFQPTLHYAWRSSEQDLWLVSARARLTAKDLKTRPSAQQSNGPTQSQTFGLAPHKFGILSWVLKKPHQLPSIIGIHLGFGFSCRHDGTLIQQVGQVCTSTEVLFVSICTRRWY